MPRSYPSIGTLLIGAALVFSPALKAQTGLGEKYALLVGVRGYDQNQLRDLKYSEPDVVELGRVLRETGYRDENIVLMTLTVGAEQSRFLPLAQQIRKELRLLLAGLESGDSIVLAFAGHGVQFRGDEETYFCPMDAQLTDKNTLIALGEIYEELEKCPAQFKLLLVDACRNDPLSDHSRSRLSVDLESVTRPNSKQPPGGVAAFFSCSAGQKAFEHSDLEHGVFFHFLIEGLRGAADIDDDKSVTLSELQLFTKKRVTDFVRKEYGRFQVPDVHGDTRGLVPIVTLEALAGAFLGAQVLDLTPALSTRLDINPNEKGVVVRTILPTGPAAKQGLQPRDLIRQVDGVSVRGSKEFINLVKNSKPGRKIELDLLREGAQKTLQLVLDKRPGPAEIAEQYRLRAEDGDVVARRELAKRYLEGYGLPKDESLAARWMKKAAFDGDAEAQYKLGRFYTRGIGVTKDLQEATAWYRKSADQGNEKAQLKLGFAYERGRGVEKDSDEALKWFTRAAENGSSLAQLKLGNLYFRGRGVGQNYIEAFKWLEKSAAQRESRAMMLLGWMYETGNGVNKDQSQAKKWYHEAGKLGESKALVSLGEIFELGAGAEKDENEAFRWYMQAAKQGNDVAQSRVASFLLEGRGGKDRDRDEAIQWYRRAAASGNKEAKDYLQKNGL